MAECKGKELSLLELQQRVKSAVESASKEAVWVRAEIAEVKYNPAGHCYMDLVDYNGEEREIAAKARAVIWSRNAVMLIPFFETATGCRLESGARVLLKVYVQYSELYGLTINVCDLDPSFTVGELELNRQRVIKRLETEGMFNLNSSLPLSPLPCRLAVVSSSTAAGFRDFVKHLTENRFGIKFRIDLFNAPMQGTESVEGIIAALDKIALQQYDYDAVVIIRGGGSALDLATFDDYHLALNIAQYPLPVLTGIGHDHDYHVADMVAYSYAKTPTAVADYIVGLFAEQFVTVGTLEERIKTAVKQIVERERIKLDKMKGSVALSLKMCLERHRHRLEMAGLKIQQLNPVSALNKGYAIVTDTSGDKITTVENIVKDGRVTLYMRDGKAEIEIGSVVTTKYDKITGYETEE